MSLDSRDITLISVLDTDARATANELGKTINLSPEATMRRIKKLEKKEVIKSYFAQINFSKLGYSLIRMYVSLQNITPTLLTEIIAFSKQQPDMWAVYEIDGEYDIAIGVLIRSLEQFYAFEQDFITQFGEYVQKRSVSTFTSILHFPRSYLRTEQSRETKYFEEHPEELVSLDETDNRLLELLATNARISLVDLAHQLGIAASSVQYRKRKLEQEHIILAYRAHLDISQLGYTYYKFDIILNTAKRIQEIRQFIHAHPNIIFENLCLGGSDIEFDAEFASTQELHAFINELYARFTGDIRSHTFYRAKKIHYYSYFPTRTPL